MIILRQLCSRSRCHVRITRKDLRQLITVLEEEQEIHQVAWLLHIINPAQCVEAHIPSSLLPLMPRNPGYVAPWCFFVDRRFHMNLNSSD